MDELINMVAQRTGLAPEKAQAAVDTVAEFLKTKLPEPLAGQIDSALSGDTSGMMDAAKNLGSKFGL